MFKNQLLLTALLLIFPLLISAQEKVNEKVSGKYRKLKVDVYYAVKDASGNIVTGNHGSRFTDKVFIRFYKQKRLSRKIYYSKDGSPYLTYYDHYNKSGLRDTSWSFITNEKNPERTYSYSYNAQGNRLNYIAYKKGKRNEQVISFYTSDGKLAIQDVYYWENKESATAYSYNTIGKVSEITKIYLQQNNAETNTRFQYDTIGFDYNEKHWDGDGRLNYENRYEFDDQERLITLIQMDGKGVVLERYEYRYDKYGNITDEKNYSGEDGTLRHHETTYEYDKKGNWIKSTTLYNDEPYEIVIRKIRY